MSNFCPETVGTWCNFNTQGVCMWCGRNEGKSPAPLKLRKTYDDEECVIDPVTLEPDSWPYADGKVTSAYFL